MLQRGDNSAARSGALAEHPRAISFDNDFLNPGHVDPLGPDGLLMGTVMPVVVGLVVQGPQAHCDNTGAQRFDFRHHVECFSDLSAIGRWILILGFCRVDVLKCWMLDTAGEGEILLHGDEKV